MRCRDFVELCVFKQAKQKKKHSVGRVPLSSKKRQKATINFHFAYDKNII